MSDPTLSREWERWQALWRRAGDAGAVAQDAPHQIARARRGLLVTRLVESAVAGAAILITAAALRHAGNPFEAALGLVVGVVCLFFCTVFKNALGYDDSLDVFGVHCIGGIVGALGTGILVNPALGGAGIMDYTAVPPKVADYDFAAQMISQIWGVCTTLVWSGIGSAILYKVVDVIVGLRVNVETEREGLDVTEHTERAYNM